jgi:hypothetical protein
MPAWWSRMERAGLTYTGRGPRGAFTAADHEHLPKLAPYPFGPPGDAGLECTEVSVRYGKMGLLTANRSRTPR